MGLFTKWGKWQDVGLHYNYKYQNYLIQCQTSECGKKRIRKVDIDSYCRLDPETEQKLLDSKFTE